MRYSAAAGVVCIQLLLSIEYLRHPAFRFGGLFLAICPSLLGMPLYAVDEYDTGQCDSNQSMISVSQL
jgi:hypothetical protein